MASLIVSIEGRIVRIVRLRDGRTLVGRSLQSSLVLDRAAVSKYHAEFTYRSDAPVVLRDLESRNGTLVNGERVSVTPLAHGDVIRIADVELQFVAKDLHGAEELPPPPPDESREPEADTQQAPLESQRPHREERRIGGPGGASWVGDAVAFTVAARGREIQAYITADALLTHFGVLIHGPDAAARAIEAYEEHHVEINVAAWNRFAETEREPIRVRTSDFE